MAHDAKEGHLSSALSCIDLLVALFDGWLRTSPDALARKDRDRFILSKGHGCAALYGILAHSGFIRKEELATYCREGSRLPNHPCQHALPFLECSAGSLGHGLGIATGMLYGLRLDGIDAKIAVLLGDGECNEGSVWESAMFAAAQKLDHLLAIVDYNGIQAVGRTDELMGHTSLSQKFRAFGWAARDVNGNDIDSILAALRAVPFEPGRPSALIAKTQAGVGFMNDQVLWHYRTPSDDDLAKAIQELGEAPLHDGYAKSI